MDYSLKKGKIGNYKGKTVFIYNVDEYYLYKSQVYNDICVIRDEMDRHGMMPMIHKGKIIGYMSKLGNVKDQNPGIQWDREKVAVAKEVAANEETSLPPIEVPTGFFDKYSVVVDTFFKEWKDAFD